MADLRAMGTPHCCTDRLKGLPLHAATPAARTPTGASSYTPRVARWSCAACGAMIDQERPGAGSALFFANLEEAHRIGTLLVTCTREIRP